MVFMVGGGPAQVPEAGKRVLDRPGPEDILRCLGKAACGGKAAACARWHVLFHSTHRWCNKLNSRVTGPVAR